MYHYQTKLASYERYLIYPSIIQICFVLFSYFSFYLFLHNYTSQPLFSDTFNIIITSFISMLYLLLLQLLNHSLTSPFSLFILVYIIAWRKISAPLYITVAVKYYDRSTRLSAKRLPLRHANCALIWSNILTPLSSYTYSRSLFCPHFFENIYRRINKTSEIKR